MAYQRPQAATLAERLAEPRRHLQVVAGPRQVGKSTQALRDARRSRKATPDELWHYAKLDRVANVMRPYLEAVA